MTKPTVVPIHKRFPGQHASRLKIWFPTGWSLGFEGRMSKEVAEFVVAALLHGTDEGMRGRLDEMTRQLKQKPIKNKVKDTRR